MNPLVLVHGFMGGSEQWNLQRDTLGKDRDLFTPDLPGFGKNNQSVAPDRIGGFAEHVLDELTGQGIGTFDLLGHSMGGMIVQEMVATAPERVKRLILYGTASTGDLPGRFETFEQSRQRAAGEGVTGTADRISATWFLKNKDAREYQNCAAIARLSTMQALHAGLTAMENWSRTENLKNIGCPALIVWGEHDRTYLWPQIERLWRDIAGASLAVIPGCSHAVHMEKPEIFNQVVKDFLDGS